MQTKLVSVRQLDTKEAKEGLLEAAEKIRLGGLVVFPTETVYGLGADATNPAAAENIYKAKGRPSDNPLIIHVATPEDAEPYAVTSPLYYMLASRFMPGPLTVIMPVRSTIPPTVTASLPTVAVRCPEHPAARELIRLAGVPIAAPSANLSGSPSPTTAAHAAADMMGRVDMILDGGPSHVGLESTIVKIEDDGSLLLLRPGGITKEELEVMGCSVHIADAVVGAIKEGERVLSPGMKYKHYAPKTPLYLLDGDREACFAYLKERQARMQADKRLGVLAYGEDVSVLAALLPDARILSFGSKEDEWEQAQRLFALLRESDTLEVHELYAPLPSKNGMGLALYNRMIRAAAHQIIKTDAADLSVSDR